jgi:ArsR family transcriptional regulator, arsenate/arsenite/antimonite-responsive transcriptional repressor
MKAIATIPVSCCAPGAPPLSEEARTELAARFKALADPARVAIVNRLAGAGEVCVCAFVDDLHLSQPTVSHHLRILREAGLVEASRRGTWAYYRLVPETVTALGRALAA